MTYWNNERHQNVIRDRPEARFFCFILFFNTAVLEKVRSLPHCQHVQRHAFSDTFAAWHTKIHHYCHSSNVHVMWNTSLFIQISHASLWYLLEDAEYKYASRFFFFFFPPQDTKNEINEMKNWQRKQVRELFPFRKCLFCHLLSYLVLSRPLDWLPQIIPDSKVKLQPLLCIYICMYNGKKHISLAAHTVHIHSARLSHPIKLSLINLAFSCKFH